MRTILNSRGALPVRPVSAPGLGGIFLEDGVQSSNEEICVRLRKDQRRAQLDDIVVRTVRTGEDAAIAQPINDVGGLERRLLPRFAIQHKIDSQEESGPAHVADQIVTLLQLPQTADEMSP